MISKLQEELDRVKEESKKQKQRADDEAAEAERQKKRADDEAAEAERQKKRADDEAAEAEKQKQRADDETAEAERQKKRADDEAEKTRDTVYVKYLGNVETHMHSIVRVETDRKKAATGQAAKVDGKVYPRGLRPWVAFPQLHRQQYSDLATLFGDDHLFPPYYDTLSIARDLSPDPRCDEQDIRPFIRACLEVPAMRIVRAFLTRTQDPRYTGLYFRFRNNAYGTAPRELTPDTSNNPPSAASSVSGNGRNTSSHRSSSPLKRKLDAMTKLAPDRWGLRIRSHERTNDTEIVESILPGEYKAVHKVRGDDFRSILGHSDAPPAESLIDACAQRKRSGKSQKSADDVAEKRLKDEMTIAQVLCQAYHYMIVFGTMYSYVSSGESTVFLKLAPESPDILLYHYVDHALSTTPITEPATITESATPTTGPERDLTRVPASQMATLVVQALAADLHRPEMTADLLETLPRWPDPKAKVSRRDRPGGPSGRSPPRGDDTDNNDHGSRGGLPLLPAPANSDRDTTGTSGLSRSFSRSELPRREYCTQACLLGLARGGLLDPACPNMPEHVRAAQQETKADGPPSHLITAAELRTLLLDQLTYSLGAGVECLMKYGLFGTIGTLFKVTLCMYGYTFVAKGVQDADAVALRAEAALYANPAAQPLQGMFIPVCLGYIELNDSPYIMPSGACIWHLMLLSWVGVSLDQHVPDAVPDVEQALADVKYTLYCHGIYHRDLYETNAAWNAERQCVMALDFDHAFVMDEDDYDEDDYAEERLMFTTEAETTDSIKVESEGDRTAVGTPVDSTSELCSGEKRKHNGNVEDNAIEKRTRTELH